MDLRVEGKHIKANVRYLTPDVALAGIEWDDGNRAEWRKELFSELNKHWNRYGRNPDIVRQLVLVPDDVYFIEDTPWDDEDKEQERRRMEAYQLKTTT